MALLQWAKYGCKLFTAPSLEKYKKNSLPFESRLESLMKYKAIFWNFQSRLSASTKTCYNACEASKHLRSQPS
jgi:hypothetical protein